MGSTRREFLTTSSRLTGAFAAGLARADERPAKAGLGNFQPPTSNFQSPTSNAQSRERSSDLVRMDALALSKAIHAKQASCREVMTAFLEHIDRINPHVNAIVSLQDRDDLFRQADERDAQLARGASAGWMHGLPHAVKDLASTKGIRTTFGHSEPLVAREKSEIEPITAGGEIGAEDHFGGVVDVVLRSVELEFAAPAEQPHGLVVVELLATRLV